MQEELKECTFMPKISSTPYQFEKVKRQAPKGFVESVARVREAHNRKQEIQKIQQNLGKLSQHFQ